MATWQHVELRLRVAYPHPNATGGWFFDVTVKCEGVVKGA